jgi:thermostable 8-oxoguanine DNA glycosylase
MNRKHVLVDPINFTNFKRTIPQLDAAILFSILAAGKTAVVAARALDTLLEIAGRLRPSRSNRPFYQLYTFNVYELATMMRAAGIGCYNQKAATIHMLLRRRLNLRKCTVDDLEQIAGIGPKTSRLFILHTRPKQRLAVLDVHILKDLQSRGHTVPDNTPSSSKRYAEIEQLCLRYADKEGMTPADWDLSTWNARRRILKLSRLTG